MQTFYVILAFILLVILTNIIVRYIYPKDKLFGKLYREYINKKTKPIIGFLFVSMIVGVFYVNTRQSSDEANIDQYQNDYVEDKDLNACVISQDFIRMDLNNPETADFDYFDCSSEKNSDGSFSVLRSVVAKNSFGVEKKYIYKLRIKFIGLDPLQSNDWKLIGIQSEEYGK